jgi:hypothetical protein
VEPPPPPLRRRLDQEGSFETTRPQEIVPDPIPRGDTFSPEVTRISDLEAEGFIRPWNPLITDLSMPVLVQIVPPEVTSPDHRLIRRLAMEENDVTSTGSPHTPTSVVGGEVVFPPLPPSPSRNASHQMATTSVSGEVPIMTTTIVHSMVTQNLFVGSFSYGMSDST